MFLKGFLFSCEKQTPIIVLAQDLDPLPVANASKSHPNLSGRTVWTMNKSKRIFKFQIYAGSIGSVS